MGRRVLADNSQENATNFGEERQRSFIFKLSGSAFIPDAELGDLLLDPSTNHPLNLLCHRKTDDS